MYLEGVFLLRAGFAPSRLIEVEFTQGRVILRLYDSGRRVVSSKKAGAVPVLDINSLALREAFGDVEVLQVRVTYGQIELTPVRSEAKRRSRTRNNKVGCLFSGGGFFDEAARQAGFEPAFAVEVDERYAATYEANHPGARLYNMCVSEVPLDELPEVELLIASPPCQPFSKGATRERGTGAKRDRTLPPEAHPLGDLSVAVLLFVHALNPATVVVEEVPAFLDSGAYHIMRGWLQRIGYTVEAAVFDASEFGSLTKRKRAVVVAHSGGRLRWPAPFKSGRTLAEILEEAEDVSGLWFDPSDASKGWLFRHWERQRAKGNGLVSAQLTAESSTVPTITHRYVAGQGDNPVLRHPEKPNTFRWLTLRELRRLHDVPDSYVLPSEKTVAGEMIGQGVVVSLFRMIVEAVTGRVVSALGGAVAGSEDDTSRGQLSLAFAA